MTDGYGTHADYMAELADAADSRQAVVEEQLRVAFLGHIEQRTVDVIVLDDVTVAELAEALVAHPMILKPLIITCNIASRAIARDVGLRGIDTYNPRLNETTAMGLAGYIKPFLPRYVELPALSRGDRVAFIDKEMRAGKGRWEVKVRDALNRYSREPFIKRKFVSGGDQFELDAATPEVGDISIGVDVKRIEARADIHKRADEIVNKALKLKSVYPQAQFAAVVYYPFVTEHGNIQSRLKSSAVDAVMFASETADSVETVAQLLLAQFEIGPEN